MSEQLRPSEESHPENQSEVHGNRYPSEQELREFERLRNGYGRLAEYSIESFARDPSNPTEEEIRLLNEHNERGRYDTISFEEFFGYPDPREASVDNQDASSGPGPRE